MLVSRKSGVHVVTGSEVDDDEADVHPQNEEGHPPRTGHDRPADEALERAAALFRAIGDLARLRLLHDIGDAEWCVTELAAHSGTKLSTLSQQLRVLYQERIVTRRREGKHIYYRVSDEHVRDLVRAAIDHAVH